MSIAENVAANKAFKDAVELIGELGDQPSRFWQLMLAYCQTKLPPEPAAEPELVPFGYEAAIAFEQEFIPFGKHEGCRVGDLPSGYLIRLTEDTPWMRRLRRYLASSVFQNRQDA